MGISIKDLVTQDLVIELDSKTTAAVYAGEGSYDEALAQLQRAFDEAIARQLELQALKTELGSQLKVAQNRPFVG